MRVQKTGNQEKENDMSEQMQTVEAVRTAIQMEIDGKEFYLKAAQASQNSLGKSLFQQLAKEEDIHRLKFEEIYKAIQANKAWPEVDITPHGGKELETLSLVRGSTIQSKHLGKDITESFKTLVGGELKAYNEMMNDARALATKRMAAEAEALGADAVVNIRYASAAVMQGAAEVIAYGTAVKFKS